MLSAVELALEAGAPTKTHILNMLHRLIDGKPIDSPAVKPPNALTLTTEPQAKSQSQNLDHLEVATRHLEHTLLQSPEGERQFDERRAGTECARFALNNHEIAPPVVGRVRTPPSLCPLPRTEEHHNGLY